MHLPKKNQLILFYVAWLLRERESVTTREVYGEYSGGCRLAKMDYVKERRFLEIINELDMLGILDTGTLSRGEVWP